MKFYLLFCLLTSLSLQRPLPNYVSFMTEKHPMLKVSKHLGTNLTVSGFITHEGYLDGLRYFILGPLGQLTIRDGEKREIKIFIKKSNVSKFSKFKNSELDGSNADITGRVMEINGELEIELQNLSDLKIYLINRSIYLR